MTNNQNQRSSIATRFVNHYRIMENNVLYAKTIKI
jgi:hypothetical protein